MDEEKVEIDVGELDVLRLAYKTFGHSDLMKFLLLEEHRFIDKWLHYIPIYEKWFGPYRNKEIGM